MSFSQGHLGSDDRLSQVFAVVYGKKKPRSKQRFPENVVEIYPSAEEARAAADAEKLRYAAEVFGPSRSSEGFMLYYLVRWI